MWGQSESGCQRYPAVYRRVILFVIAVLPLMVSGCANILRQPAPPGRVEDALVPGFDQNIRYPIFSRGAALRQAIIDSFRNETPDNYTTAADGSRSYTYLSVSGGGSDGAFGAGLLNGWSKAGGRPIPKVVTGVSTGSLIAPFAFLGTAYDPQLKEAYTTIDEARVLLRHSLLDIIWSESATDSAPLRDLVATYVDEKLLDAIAVEHAKGRRLYVASTDLDAEEPVIWDLGAIASSKNPTRVALFRQILVASAAIPAIFPPVMIDVTIDGKKYDEMHVDGGVFFQSFSIGNVVNLPAVITAAHPEFKGKLIQRLYIIRNGRVTPDPIQVKRSLTDIALRSIGTMLKVSSINDLYRLYLSSVQDGLEFNFIAIPDTYKYSTLEQFNKGEMNRQYDFGYEMALQGIPWQQVPPGYLAN